MQNFKNKQEEGRKITRDLRVGIIFSLLCTFLLVFSFSLVSATNSLERNTDLNVIHSSGNATSCNVSWIQNNAETPNILNLELSKAGTTFTGTIDLSNFSNLGTSCYSLVCSDGSSYETENNCFVVTPNGENGTANIVFFCLAILLLYSMSMLGFFGRNIPLTILSGMALIFLGVYIQNNGIIIFQDTLTNYIGIVTWAWGGLSALWAGLEQLNII